MLKWKNGHQSGFFMASDFLAQRNINMGISALCADRPLRERPKGAGVYKKYPLNRRLGGICIWNLPCYSPHKETMAAVKKASEGYFVNRNVPDFCAVKG